VEPFRRPRAATHIMTLASASDACTGIVALQSLYLSVFGPR
jgi:hypothetical protein